MVVRDHYKSKKFNLIRLINSKGAWHLTGDQIQLRGMMRKAHAPSCYSVQCSNGMYDQ